MCVCVCAHACVRVCVCGAGAVCWALLPSLLGAFRRRSQGRAGRLASSVCSGCRGVMDKRQAAVCRALSAAGELRASTGVLGRSRRP